MDVPEDHSLHRSRLSDGDTTGPLFKFAPGQIIQSSVTKCLEHCLNVSSTSLTDTHVSEIVPSNIISVVLQKTGLSCFACPIRICKDPEPLERNHEPYDHVFVYQGGRESTLSEQMYPALHSIEVYLSHLDVWLPPTSYINLKHTHTIQYQDETKLIGHVVDEHVPLLGYHWSQELSSRLSRQDEQAATMDRQCSSANAVSDSEVRRPQHPSLAYARLVPAINIRPISKTDKGSGFRLVSEIGGDLHSAFETIKKPKAYFKRGRVFMILWPSPAAGSERTIHLKVRRCIAFRVKPAHCLCLPINTYSGQGTSKQGIQVQDHAAVIPVGGHVQLHPDERPLQKPPIVVKFEDPSVTSEPTSRVNYGKVLTVEYNWKVRNIGRVTTECLKTMEESFAETIGLLTKS